MKELYKALHVVSKYENMSVREIHTEFCEYTDQQIPKEVYMEFVHTGLSPIDYITSDYLTQKGYRNIYWHEISNIM